MNKKILPEETIYLLDNLVDCFGLYKAIYNEYDRIEDFTVEYLNRSAIQFIVIDKDKVIGKRMSDLIPSFDKTNLFLTLSDVMQTGVPYTVDTLESVNYLGLKLVSKLQIVKYGDSVAVSWRDKSEQKAAEDSYRISEEKFRRVFSASPIPMAIIDTVNETIIDVNERFCMTLGYRREEIIGYNSKTLNFYEDIHDRSSIFYNLRQSGRVHNYEVNIRTKSNKIITVLLSAESVLICQIPCHLVQVNDITERKFLEKEVLRLDRLNLIGQLAAGIGHEIRNPLTSVRGFLQIFQSKKEFTEYSEHLSIMIQELDRANQIISDFLSLSKTKTVQKKPESLKTIILSLKALITSDAFQSNNDVLFEVADDSFNIIVDEREIKQLILNLVRNGFEAMRGGVLFLKTSVQGNELILEIKDQGTGIKAEILDKLGTPFITSKDTGTGLGLAICYSIAERNNASIQGSIGLVAGCRTGLIKCLLETPSAESCRFNTASNTNLARFEIVSNMIKS
ncbi:PAS domain S-box protein [Heliobacterium chlorum]|uniref:histidine kinase n=1 Tax=Heliobacterium chlorum TaxID=2698 RepID=A0ABR7T593_HELCL|nr:PAS domain-containing sensor histidine kinase [Heliobacterium chlorum]MBC9785535.1 PAS domain S-box protein [Heliobacterium chlorum]